MGSVYRVLLTNTSKVQNGSIFLSERDLPNNKLSCLMHSMSFRIEGLAFGNQVVFTKTADVSGRWSEGSGEFPQPGCNLSSGYISFPPNLDEVRVMAQTRSMFGHNKMVSKKAQVSASGTIVLPEPNKQIFIEDIQLIDPDSNDPKGTKRVQFRVILKGSNNNGSDKISVAVSSYYAHCPANDFSQFCYFHGLKECDYYFFPEYIGCRSVTDYISYNTYHGYKSYDNNCSFEQAGHGNGCQFLVPIPSPAPGPSCNKDKKCADLRVDVRTSVPSEDSHFHWDEAFEQIFVDKEVVK